jgi:hypothetical protein
MINYVTIIPHLLRIVWSESGKSGVCINGISITVPMGPWVFYMLVLRAWEIPLLDAQVNTGSMPSCSCMVTCNVRICCMVL